MPPRPPRDLKLVQKKLNDDSAVLQYTLSQIDTYGKTGLESPEKLAMFYAGYTAMRSIWEIRAKRGDYDGDSELEWKSKKDQDHFYIRVNNEILHARMGQNTETLLRVNKFKYWAKKFLASPAPGVPGGPATEQ